MDENKLLSEVADTIIDKPVIFTVTVRRKWIWDKPRRSFRITGSSLGTMIKISKELLAIDPEIFSKENVLEKKYLLINMHAKRMAKIVAYAVVNRKQDPPRSLVSLFENNLTANELQRIVSII